MIMMRALKYMSIDTGTTRCAIAAQIIEGTVEWTNASHKSIMIACGRVGMYDFHLRDQFEKHEEGLIIVNESRKYSH